MTYYFVGGEDHDFTKIGTLSVDTSTTAARRSAYSRCSLRVSSSNPGDGWAAPLDAPRSSFWFTARLYQNSFNTNNGNVLELITFLDGAVRRLGIQFASSDSRYQLFKKSAAGTKTVLATSSISVPTSTLTKLDLQVVYGTSGSIALYGDGTLLVSYSGDVTTDSATTLNSFVLGQTTWTAAGTPTHWSEIICGTDDTRSMNLVTLAPSANGNAFAWTNSYANLNEVTLDDTTLCSSSNAGDIAQMAISSAGLPSGQAVRALCVSARAQKGATGPQNLQFGVRTGGNDYFGATQSLNTSFARSAYVFETNPATSTAFSYAELSNAGFNIGVKSIA